MHEIECVDLVHHINELNDMNEIAKTMELCAILYHCFLFANCKHLKERWPKKGQLNFEITIQHVRP